MIFVTGSSRALVHSIPLQELENGFGVPWTTSIWCTRRSGCYVPILLAPVEGWGPCGPCWRPLAPSRVAISKLWTLNFEKLEICVTLIANLHYIEAKFDYGYFIFFCVVVLRFYTKKFHVILSKNEGVTLIFPIKNEIKIRKKSPPRLHFGSKWLEIFCVKFWNHNAKWCIK